MTEAKRLPIKIIVDQSRCGGHARCIEEVPGVFGYDGVSNKAYVLETADVACNRAAVERAIVACPELAIRWADDDQNLG
jgi:ferredoxin